MEKLLTFQEVMEQLGTSPKTLRKILLDGRLKYARVGREFRFRQKWVEAFLEGE